MNIFDFLINFGYLGIFAIVFTESGIPFGFFFPGDSLLITAGILVNRGIFNFYLLMGLCILAAILGNIVGYYLGKKWGRGLFEKKNNFVFNPKNLKRTEDFYNKYGDRAILLARFIPVIRTFTPIFAGIANMKYSKFLLYTIVSAFVWAGGLISAGYFLVQLIPNIDQYILLVVGIIIVLSVAPLIFKIFRK